MKVNTFSLYSGYTWFGELHWKKSKPQHTIDGFFRDAGQIEINLLNVSTVFDVDSSYSTFNKDENYRTEHKVRFTKVLMCDGREILVSLEEGAIIINKIREIESKTGGFR